jgi:hypothetical protein
MTTMSIIRSMRLSQLAIVAIAVMVLLPAASAAAQSPTLADLAKKEEARRKSLKVPTKVFTKDDLPPSAAVVPAAPAAAPAAGAAGQAAAAAADPNAEAPKEEEKGEEWWRARMEQAREGLRRNEMFAEALNSRMNALAVDVANRDDPAQRQVLSLERQKAVQELARVQDDIAKLKKQMADIEEEARVAGVPPGWLR